MQPASCRRRPSRPTSFHDLGDRVLLVAYQRGCAKTTGVPLDMRFGQVWTFRGEQLIRTENYADPAEALEAAGL